MSMESIREAKKRYEALLLAKKNVVAVGIGYKEVGGRRTDELCIVVSVVEKVPEAQLLEEDIVPKEVEGVGTDVQESGMIRALQARTDKWRPAPGGVSCGHKDITAGTLGCLVGKGGQILILSNNHVLANSNEAQKGDPIFQPGPYDGGTSADQIATLEDFVPINFGSEPPVCPWATGAERFLNAIAGMGGSQHRVMAYQRVAVANLVDAAIAIPLSDDLVERRILEIGEPRGAGEASLGTRVKKSGRTTELTQGEIIQVDVMVRVSYGPNRVATFTDQLMAGAMSAGGDSGSAVLDDDDLVVGLLFAGSEATTVINRIQDVTEALGVEIVT